MLQFVDIDTVHPLFIETLLIGVEGAKTSAGSPDAPRKAKRLERKSTEPFYIPTKLKKL